MGPRCRLEARRRVDQVGLSRGGLLPADVPPRLGGAAANSCVARWTMKGSREEDRGVS